MKNNTSIPPVTENPITKRIQNHIEAVAKGMIGCSNLGPDDLQDLCQELSFQVIKAAKSYSPENGSFYTFAQAVVKKHRDRIFRYRMRRGLDCPTVSIDSVSKQHDEMTPSPIDSISLAQSREKELEEERFEKIGKVVEKLDPRLKAICNLLMDGYTKEEICREMHMSSRTFFRLLGKVRAEMLKERIVRG